MEISEANPNNIHTKSVTYTIQVNKVYDNNKNQN